MERDAGSAGGSDGDRLLPDDLRLPLSLPFSGVCDDLGVVPDGHGAGVDSAEGEDESCTGGRGSAAGTHLILIVVDYAVWMGNDGLYPHTLSGLVACYVAAIPFYRNDLLSTAIVAGLAFGVPVLVRRFYPAQVAAAVAAGTRE